MCGHRKRNRTSFQTFAERAVNARYQGFMCGFREVQAKVYLSGSTVNEDETFGLFRRCSWTARRFALRRKRWSMCWKRSNSSAVLRRRFVSTTVQSLGRWRYQWAYWHGVTLVFSRPGQPTDNGQGLYEFGRLYVVGRYDAFSADGADAEDLSRLSMGAGWIVPTLCRNGNSHPLLSASVAFPCDAWSYGYLAPR